MRRDDGGFALEVELKVNLPGINKAEAEPLWFELTKPAPIPTRSAAMFRSRSQWSNKPKTKRIEWLLSK